VQHLKNLVAHALLALLPLGKFCAAVPHLACLVVVCRSGEGRAGGKL
jgi:hypothetical protein